MIDLRGVSISLSGDEAVVSELNRDFAAFGFTERAPDISLSVGARPRPWPSAPIWALPAKGARAWDDDAVRCVVYDDGSWASFDFFTGRGEVGAEEPERLREIAYLAVLGLGGEMLDARGLHRVHAMGFVYAGLGGLLILESSGGKSEFSLRLSREEGFGLLSDDTPLMHGNGELASFPTRFSFRSGADLSAVPARLCRSFRRRRFGSRTLVDARHFNLADGAPLTWLLAGEKAGDESGRIADCGRGRAMTALFDAMVVGRGVAQMAEWRLRPAAAVPLVRAAWRRFSVARAATRRARTGVMRMDRDPARNTANLRDWIRGS